MQFLSIGQVRQHCKADEADDAVLAIYANAAEKSVIALLNRNLYPTSTALSNARAGLSASLTAALAAYDAAVSAANALSDSRAKEMALLAAENDLTNARIEQINTIHGMVIVDDIIAAMLLVCGSLWANREEVVVGPSMAAVQLPHSAYNLVWPYRRLGSL